MGTHHQHRGDAAEPHIAHAQHGDSHVHAFHSELPWHNPPAHNSGALDAKSSVHQLVAAGKMINAMPHADTHSAHQLHANGYTGIDAGQARAHAERSEQHGDAVVRRPVSPPKVKLVFEEESHDRSKPKREPDFVINDKGKIEAHNDFEKHPHPDGQIVVRVSRHANQMEPTALEHQGLNKLMTYLNGRIKEDYPASKHEKLDLRDDQGLVGETLKHHIAHQPHWNMSDETKRQVEHVNRFEGGHGTMSHHQMDGYFPRREVPQAKDESYGVAAMKDAVASLFQPDKSHPYETVRHKQDGGYAVGRYGLGGAMISAWLAELLGDPPDLSKLDELAAKGLLPKEFAAAMHDPQFSREFGQFVDKLKSGQGDVTAAELHKFLPKELQETIATDMVKQYSAAGGKDPCKVALGMLLGKSPDRLTAQDLNDDGNKQFMGAAARLFGLAQARQMTGANDSIEWSGTSPYGAKIAQVAERTARETGTIGWCARGVETALGKLGIHFSGNAADTRGFFEHDSRFQRVSMNDLRPGDVVVRGSSRSHQWGHIFVYLGNGREASDHVQSVTNGANYGQSAAFRFVGDQRSRNA